jgi:hypothetical protein|nr:MAG TPA: cysteine-rich protein [Caudoviricetes sp.]
MRYSAYKDSCRKKLISPIAGEDSLIFYRGKNRDGYDSMHIKVKNPRDLQDEDGTYHLHPIGFSVHSYYVVCPYCGEIHIHGRIGGYRVPHCSKAIGLADYFIEEAEGNA